MQWHHGLLGLSSGRTHEQDPLDTTSGEEHYSYIKVAPLTSVFSYKNNTGPDGSGTGTPLTLALVLAMLTVAVLILALALLISKVRRRQSLDTVDAEMDLPQDPYLQAIMFPSEPQGWPAAVRQKLTKAGQKLLGKHQPHDTHIPESLRYQLKQIYVY